MDLAQIIWIAAVGAFIILEAVTVSLTSIWFAIGALAGFIVSIFWPTGAGIGVQVGVFVVVSALCLLALKPVVHRFINIKRQATNADANIGKFAQVVSEITPGNYGRVKLENLEWMAKSNTTLSVGTWCKVDAIEGAKLLVSPQDNV